MAKGIAHREWAIYRDDYRDDNGRVNEQAFRAAVQFELSMAEHIGERLGVAIVAAPVRTRHMGDGPYFTTGWVFKTATVPSAREAQDADALEDDADLVEIPTLAEVE